MNVSVSPRVTPDVIARPLRRLALRAALVAAVLGVIAVLYWPIQSGGFVWVDKALIHDVAWLRQSGNWTELLFRNFYDWSNYFRPLGIAILTIEVRAFDIASGPMHLVSLALHLCNTLLVGLLAERLLVVRGVAICPWTAAMAMLLYGLHPALIEPVVWISCQFDLIVVLFSLLGLLLNARIRRAELRAPCVAVCFFLAACAKESAVVFPLLLVVLDWTMQRDLSRVEAMRALLRRQWLTYLLVLTGGIVYLALRHQALDNLMQPAGAEPFLSLRRVQLVCSLLLTYWRLLLWPMIDQSPLHEVETGAFGSIGPALFASDVAAVLLIAAALTLLLKRTAIGALLAGSTVALLPVLHIVPIEFDSSLYHERYAMTAIAMACSVFPSVLASIPLARGRARATTLAGAVLLLAWLGVAALNIRVTLPLWSDETRLWLWVLQKHPESVLAKNHLLNAYMDRDDRAGARQVAGLLLSERKPCPVCMVNVANLALRDRDLATAKLALGRAQPSMQRVNQPRLTQAFTLTTGRLRELEGDARGAELAYRSAIALQPLDPQARMTLALLLARQGNREEAGSQARQALALFAPDDREAQMQQFKQVLHAAQTTNPPQPAK